MAWDILLEFRLLLVKLIIRVITLWGKRRSCYGHL